MQFFKASAPLTLRKLTATSLSSESIAISSFSFNNSTSKVLYFSIRFWLSMELIFTYASINLAVTFLGISISISVTELLGISISNTNSLEMPEIICFKLISYEVYYTFSDHISP